MLASSYALDLTLSDDQRLAFEAAFKAHRNRVYRLGLRYGGGRTSWAEDLTQDVFMKLLETLPSLSACEDLGGWIYRVTTNAALSRLRKERSFVGWMQQAWFGPEASEDSADAQLELSETARAAQSVLDSLPPKERVVLSMKVLDGKAQREIALTLGLSEGYVSKLLARAWERVRAAGWEVRDDEA